MKKNTKKKHFFLSSANSTNKIQKPKPKKKTSGNAFISVTARNSCGRAAVVFFCLVPFGKPKICLRVRDCIGERARERVEIVRK